MANPLPPLLVTFDTDVLMAGRTQVWQEYAKVGTCYIPEVVYDEIDRLTDQAVEPAIEQVAREFMRFFADSGWIATDAQQTHRDYRTFDQKSRQASNACGGDGSVRLRFGSGTPGGIGDFCVQQPASAEAAGFCGGYESLRDYRGDAVKLGEERGTPAGGDSAIANFDAHPRRTQIDSAL